MTFNSDNSTKSNAPSVENPEDRSKPCCSIKLGFRKIFYLMIIILLAVAGALVWNYSQGIGWKDLFTRQSSQIISDKSVDQTIFRSLEQQLRVSDEKIKSLTVRIEKLEQTPSAVVTENNTTAAPESITNSDQSVARLKSDMVSLSAALSALQEQLTQSMRSADKTKGDAQASIAVVIAFTQLQTVTDAGKAFTKELQSLRQTAGNDNILLEQIAKLEPFAISGAPLMPDLREDYAKLVSQAQSSLRKAEAKNWRERLLAELQGLVSIRTINAKGENSDAFGAIEEDLENGNLDAAIIKTDQLPEAAKNVLNDWRAKAEARKNIETSINIVADHLIAKGREGDNQPQAMPDNKL